MKVKRKIIEIDQELCNGCGQCVPACAEGAIEIVEGKARLVAEKFCDGLGACLGECPQGALKIIERDADDFDEKAVEIHLASIEKDKGPEAGPAPPTIACSCPSTRLEEFRDAGEGSNLAHWPVQINLIPAGAPFLKGADLLVAADCTAVAYPGFHQRFVKGHTVMMGCPKFDDAQQYIQKFAAILKEAAPASLTAVIMEVPCCTGMVHILKKAMEASGSTLPLKVYQVGVRGSVRELQ